MSARTRLVLALSLGILACEIEIDECADKRSRKACEGADVDPSGQCFWVEVSKHRVVAGECERIESHGECVGIVGTQAGCGVQECGTDEPTHAFFRIDDDGEVELFDNPECGPSPVGDWTECIASDVPECA